MPNRKSVSVSISIVALLVVLAQADAKAETRHQRKPGAERKASPRQGRRAVAARRARRVRQATRLRERAAAVEPLIAAAAIKYQVDPYALWVIAYKETRFRWWLKSPAGAEGLMQLMPGTAAEYGVRNSYNVPEAIDAAARYVRKAMNQFGGRLDLVWASYNAGFGAVEAYQSGRTIRLRGGKVINPRRVRTGGVPPYSETRDYVAICWKVYAAAKNSGVFPADVVARSRGGVLPDPQAYRTLLAVRPLDDGELDFLGGRQKPTFSAFAPQAAGVSSPPVAVDGGGLDRRTRLEEVFYDVHSGARYLVRGGRIVEPVEESPRALTITLGSAVALPAFTATSVFDGARSE